LVPNNIFEINIFEINFEKAVGIIQDSCPSHFWDQKAFEIPVLEIPVFEIPVEIKPSSPYSMLSAIIYVQSEKDKKIPINDVHLWIDGQQGIRGEEDNVFVCELKERPYIKIRNKFQTNSYISQQKVRLLFQTLKYILPQK